MTQRSALKSDLFAEEAHRQKLDELGDPLAEIDAAFAFSAPAAEVVGTFENCIGQAGVKAIFDGVEAQLRAKGLAARGGQIIDATLVPAPKQRLTPPDADVSLLPDQTAGLLSDARTAQGHIVPEISPLALKRGRKGQKRTPSPRKATPSRQSRGRFSHEHRWQHKKRWFIEVPNTSA
jgi:hypothetical protein